MCHSEPSSGAGELRAAGRAPPRRPAGAWERRAGPEQATRTAGRCGAGPRSLSPQRERRPGQPRSEPPTRAWSTPAVHAQLPFAWLSLQCEGTPNPRKAEPRIPSSQPNRMPVSSSPLLRSGPGSKQNEPELLPRTPRAVTRKRRPSGEQQGQRQGQRSVVALGGRPQGAWVTKWGGAESVRTLRAKPASHPAPAKRAPLTLTSGSRWPGVGLRVGVPAAATHTDYSRHTPSRLSPTSLPWRVLQPSRGSSSTASSSRHGAFLLEFVGLSF